jgi:hypothetical protein
MLLPSYSIIMPSKRGWDLTVWMIIFTSLTALTMVLRFCAVRVQRRGLRVDDYLIVGAFVRLASFKMRRLEIITYILIGFSHGLRRHQLLG